MRPGSGLTRPAHRPRTPGPPRCFGSGGGGYRVVGGLPGMDRCAPWSATLLPEPRPCGALMASRTEGAVVNVAGLVQGIVLVTFPAASTIFTAKGDYGLSSNQYGDMFLPQVVTAIAGSLLGSGLARRITTKRVYLLGLACSLVSMGLLLASATVKTDQSVAYPLAPGRDGIPGGGLRHGRPGPEHLRVGLSPGQRRPGRARTECAARPGHCAGAGVRGRVRRPGILVGPADPVGGIADRAAAG